MSDKLRPAADVRYLPTGMGVELLWLCLGCNTRRPSLGARGAGIRRRCAHCVKAREERKK